MPPDAADLSRFLRKTVKPMVSPWLEMLASLHVLDRPGHHSYRTAWAQQLLGSWSKERLNELSLYSQLSGDWLGLYELQSGEAPLSLHEGIHKLGALPDLEWTACMVNEGPSLSELWEIREGIKPAPDTWLAAQYEMILNPRPVREKLQDFLIWYCAEYFEREWRLVEPWLNQGVQHFMDAFRSNPQGVLNGLHPRLAVTPDAVEAQKAKLYRYTYTEIERITVRPSTFMHPHLLIGFRNGELSIPMHVQPEDAAKDTEVPADLLATMKAMADANRLHILRLLQGQSYCTQQLAVKLGISEPAVSKHLAILAESRLVATERRGAYVFYKLRSEQTEMVIVYLRQFLEQ